MKQASTENHDVEKECWKMKKCGHKEKPQVREREGSALRESRLLWTK